MLAGENTIANNDEVDASTAKRIQELWAQGQSKKQIMMNYSLSEKNLSEAAVQSVLTDSPSVTEHKSGSAAISVRSVISDNSDDREGSWRERSPSAPHISITSGAQPAAEAEAATTEEKVLWQGISVTRSEAATVPSTSEEEGLTDRTDRSGGSRGSR
eukprot:2403672-Rhodomonas_salina.3